MEARRYCSRQWKNNPEGNSEIIRAALSSQVQSTWGHWYLLDLSAGYSVAPYIRDFCFLNSFATFLGQSSCGSGGSRCSIGCAQQSCGDVAASIEISKGKASWQSHRLRSQLQKAADPVKELLQGQPKSWGQDCHQIES